MSVSLNKRFIPVMNYTRYEIADDINALDSFE